MRSTSYPTPAELDAYAKKVANHPLTIQIFPNSVKVPQRRHIRRTVNGLDTSLSAQRHSPYPSQVSASTGLLAILQAPVKGVVKEPYGTRGRVLHKAGMNLHSGPYPSQSTLNLPQPGTHMQGPPQAAAQASQKQGLGTPQGLQQPPMPHPMVLQQPQTVPHSQALQQRGMSHPVTLQQSLSQVLTPQQRPSYPPGLQRQHSVSLPQQSAPPAPVQHLPHIHTLKHQGPAPQALLPLAQTQELRHVPQAPLNMQHSRPLPQTMTVGPPTGSLAGNPGGPPVMAHNLPQPPSVQYGPRKLPDADAPPNVTVSTSTIPLSMAASLHQNRPEDLSSIVHQINQLCQARAGMGATSVCEGQIANPSPISRNLLINASSRVAHPPTLGSVSSCLVVGGLDKAPAYTPNMSAPNGIQSFHSEPEKIQHHLHRSWAQHQLAHMQQPPEGAHPCKNPRMEPPTECGFVPPQNLSYPHKVPSSEQSFPLKHPEKPQASSPLNCPGTSMPYMNGHYLQRPWGSTTASSTTPGPQDLAAFQGPQVAISSDRIPGAKYRRAKEDVSGQPRLLPTVDFLAGDFQMPVFRDQSMDVMEKMHRSALGPSREPSSGGGMHGHHPGFR